MAKSAIEFVKAALRNPLEVSTVFPTSKSLSHTLLSHADIRNAKRVVEVGAGTGAITQHMSPLLAQPSVYLGVELDATMVAFLRGAFPNLRFEAGPAEDLPKWVEPGSVDVVVSSLPWTVFPDDLQDRTLEAIVSSLKSDGGVFLTYVCANAIFYPRAKAFVAKLNSRFREVHRSKIEWRNVPPAFVFKSVR